MNTDQFGALGKNKEPQLLNLVAVLETLLAQKKFSAADKICLLKNTLATEIAAMTNAGTKSHNLSLNLIRQLERDIQTVDDVAVFCIAVKYVVAPINRAIARVPADDKKFCATAAKNILDTFGENKIALLIETWDDLGTKGCLDIERALVVEAFMNFADDLARLNISHSNFDDNIMLTAFVQEFERRLGQKRKSRGGNSLETVADFIFDYYNFSSTDKPTHFAADLEVDKWFKCRDGWIIGISCKRTLRERWKQLSQADRNALANFKIRAIWHLITYDSDLSDDKILKLGEQGQIFYLGEAYEKFSAYRNYVRPLSNFIGDVRKLI